MESDSGVSISRRKWILGFWAFLVVGVGTVLAGALAFLNPPSLRRRGRRPQQVAGAPGLKVGEVLPFNFHGEPVLLARTPEGYRALSLVCTHLGCIVEWRAQARRLFCPCHGGVYDEGGGVVSGPPPSPLPSFRVTLRDGGVLVG